MDALSRVNPDSIRCSCFKEVKYKKQKKKKKKKKIACMSFINSVVSHGPAKEMEFRMKLRYELIDADIDLALAVFFFCFFFFFLFFFSIFYLFFDLNKIDDKKNIFWFLQNQRFHQEKIAVQLDSLS